MWILFSFKGRSENECTGNWRDLDFKNDQTTVLQNKGNKKIPSLIYRNQVEFIKPHCDNNDLVHMSAHNGLVVQIILTSEAKTFKAWMLFKSVTYVLIGSLHNSFIVLSNSCKVFKIVKLIVCMCGSYLIKSVTQPPTLQAALRPCPYVPAVSFCSQINGIWMWRPDLLCSIAALVGFVLTLPNSSSNMLKTAGLGLLCLAPHTAMARRLLLASYAPLCRSEPLPKV